MVFLETMLWRLDEVMPGSVCLASKNWDSGQSTGNQAKDGKDMQLSKTEKRNMGIRYCWLMTSTVNHFLYRNFLFT